jgi:hypothetical protein
LSQGDDPKWGFVALATLDHVQVANFKDPQGYHAIWEKRLRQGK